MTPIGRRVSKIMLYLILERLYWENIQLEQIQIVKKLKQEQNFVLQKSSKGKWQSPFYMRIGIPKQLKMILHYLG